MIPVHDPVLPGVRAALDVEQVRRWLSESLPECREGLDLEKLKIYDVQYRPRKSCVILYSAKFRRPGDGRSETQLLSAVLLPDGRTPQPPPEELVSRYAASGDRPLRRPMVHLRAAGLVAYAFPFDPALPNLVGACDPATMKVEFGRLWRKRGVRSKRVTVKPLSYTPGARTALLYEVLGEARESGLPEMRHLVGKIDANRDAADLFARSWAVWRRAARRIRLAPPIGYVADLGLFLQERVDGTRLSELAGDGNFLGHVRQAARSLAVLHRLDLPLRRRRPFEQKAKAVKRWGGMLAAIRPGECSRIRSLRDRLAAELERRARVTGAVHGDFHPSNVLVADDGVTLIDLDNMCQGDCLLDVGRFLSALRTSSLRVCGTPTGLADAGEAFLQHYLSHTGEDERRARLFEATSLMITAGTGFRLQRPGWEETAQVLIDEAERVLRLAEAAGPIRARPEAGTERDEAVADRRHEADVAWACDAQYVRAALDRHVRRIYSAKPDDCTVERRRATPKRRHLRLALSGRRDAARWKISLDGYVWRRDGGGRVARRMAAVHEASVGHREVLVIPRPVAWIREIRLQVLDVPRGTPISSLLHGPEAPGVIDRLGRALSSFHGVSVSLDKVRDLRDEVSALRTRVLRSRETGSAADRVRRSMERVEAAIGRDAAPTAPVLRHLSPRRLLLAGDRIAVGEVDDVVLAHPFIDAAEVLGRLYLTGLERDRVAAHDDLAERFRGAYLANGAGDAARLAAFESAALLRLACTERGRLPENVVDRLLAKVEERLERYDAGGTQ